MDQQSQADEHQDPWVWRCVVGSLGIVAILAVLGAIVLAGLGRDVPQVLVAVASAAIGGLTGFMAPSPPGGK